MDYESEQKIKSDILQTFFSNNGKIEKNKRKFATLELKDLIKDKNLICPFCLQIGKLNKFPFSKGLFKCTNCQNKMTRKTLKNMFDWFNSGYDIDVIAYAKWVYEYRLNGFWQKIISFEQFNKRLYEEKILRQFWDEYKRLKGEYKEEWDDYNAEMDRQNEKHDNEDY